MNLIKRYRFYIVIMLIVLSYTFLKIGNNFLPIEKLSVPSALGYDVVKRGEGDKAIYEIPISVYTYPNDNVSTMTITGRGGSIPETREIRQLQSTGKFIVGLERIIVMGESGARFGIRNFIDILFSNRTVNDTAYLIVTKQTPEEILKFKIAGFPGQGEYLANMVEQARDFNFAPNNYRLIDAFVRLDVEGRSLVLPYVEIKDNKLQTTGVALFKGDKMVEKIDIEDAKILNLLRQNDVRGIFTIRKDEKNYTSYYGSVKRKIKCKEKDGKLIFNIDLALEGEVVSNSIYSNLSQDPEEIKKIENDLSKEVEVVCRKFIEKMQNEYEVDALELGRYGAAVHGRHSGIDWDDAVSRAEINVNAKVKVTEIGRGDY